MSSITPDIHQFKKVDPDPKKEIMKPEPTSVSSITNFYMYGSYFSDSDEHQEMILEKWQALSSDYVEELTEECKLEAVKWTTEPFNDFPVENEVGLFNKYAYARIDLDASDEQVKNNFIAWLAEERIRRNKPPVSKKICIKWILMAGMNLMYCLILT